MKPWEETWEFASEAQTGGNAEVHYGDSQQCVAPFMFDEPARLAAAAPEMARLLKDAYENTRDGNEMCFACGGRSGHQESCALVAVLRKAGVLP